MGDKSAISWTDATWNPVTGCDRISDGCDNCYALTLAKRLKGMGNPKYQRDGFPPTSGPGFGVAAHADVLELPLRWQRSRRIFVNSMSDLFHADVPDGYIARAWDVMGRSPQHTFQILTKRHGRMRSWLRRWADRESDRDSDRPDGMPPLARGPQAVRSTYGSGRARLFADMLDSMGEPPEGCAYPLYDWMEGWRFWPDDLFNVWLGVSVENQRWADIRVPALLDTPAAVRWLSCEPLLGPLDLFNCAGVSAIERDWTGGPGGGTSAPHPLVDWVVVGGESGPGHRPMDLRWLESIVSQCQEADVPVWVKQDSGPRSGQQGRIPDELFIQQFPQPFAAVAL